jgi:hypothetical protein
MTGDESGLSDYALQWMIEELSVLGGYDRIFMRKPLRNPL